MNPTTAEHCATALYPARPAACSFPSAVATTPAPLTIPTHDQDPLATLRAALCAPPRDTDGWIAWLSYDLGARLAPALQARDTAPNDRDWPLAELHPARRTTTTAPPPTPHAWSLDDIDTQHAVHAYTEGVRDILHHIREGDAYQVNLAHRLTTSLTGSRRALAHHLLTTTRPAYGAYIESPTHAICSLSPELFLHFDATTRRIITRPMKGTRPLTSPIEELRDSPKDTAELTMIADLMRNDLGRICEPASVRVTNRRTIEQHGTPHLGGVHQAIAQVEGVVRTGVDLPDILSATFPPGSVTGAPKLSAMRIIDRLEPARRGPFCGALGWIDHDGSFTLAVAIRTLCFTPSEPGRVAPPGATHASDLASPPPASPPPAPRTDPTHTLDYWAGAGIVADSDPDAEWRETLDKAAVLLTAAANHEAVPS